MSSTKSHFINVTQLRVGIFVHLDLGWMDHPFTTSNFKIKSEDQIEKIKKIGIKRLRYDPSRSDFEPLAEEIVSRELATPAADIQKNVVETSARENTVDPIKKQQEHRINRLIQLNKALDEGEKRFLQAGNTARQAMKDIISQPKQAVEHAEQLVNEMVDSALGESEIAILAINGNRSSDGNYIHTLNVTVLALMMARSLDVSEADARTLGMAALFHDIGKIEMSDKILRKKEPLTSAEQAYYEQHCEIGGKIAKQAGMSEQIVQIIMQHHECTDGSGYPKHLKASETSQLSKLVELINGYDNLCNPPNVLLAKTPYETLAHMFANLRHKYDEKLLKHFIKSLGIYPPGSIVQLSNQLYGVVVAVNPAHPLKPVVMLYDTSADKHPPPVVNLQDESNLSISICLRPNQLPQDALDYLNPRKRISYFIDTSLSAERPSE